MSDNTDKGTPRLKTGLAEMLKGGVIMDVTTEGQARIAEEAGATAVMALERVPSDIRKEGGVARMCDPELIERIKAAVTIPVMAKCRIGHFAEAQVLEALGVDFIDESEVLTPADEAHHVDKFAFTAPFVCGCRDLGEALRRVGEGATMLRTKGEPGTGNIVEAVRHMRSVRSAIKRLTVLGPEELMAEAKNLGAPYELVKLVAREGKLPVPNFAAGGIATPADTSLMMQLGAEAVFVGSGIFKSDEPEKRARAVVRAATHYNDPKMIAEISRGLGGAMTGIETSKLPESELMQNPRLVVATVGLLALQGGFEAHARALRDCGAARVVEVRRVHELKGLDGLVIPGGESTTLLNLMRDEPWFDALREFHADGGAIFGTCAGAILLSAEVLDPQQPSLGLLDATVRRNGYGRQVDSFEETLNVEGIGPMRAVYIRAPRIERIGPEVRVLAARGGEPVVIRQGRLIAATFHPELTADSRLHARFLAMMTPSENERSSGPAAASHADPAPERRISC